MFFERRKFYDKKILLVCVRTLHTSRAHVVYALTRIVYDLEDVRYT